MNPVRVIERSPFSIGDRVAMIQVYRKIKPASFADFAGSYWNPKEPESVKFTEEEMEQLEQDLASTGVVCLRQRREVHLKSGVMSLPALYFGMDDESLQRLVDASSHEEFGVAFGFPQTAIDAYVGRLERHDGDFPSGTDFSALAFARFVKSARYWRTELETGEVWRDAVYSSSPRLYREYMREFERSITV